MRIGKTILLATMGLVLAGASLSTASADTRWQANHPRREQVNNRLAHQSLRIRQERREGEITGARAAALHRDDHRIRREERAMASLDHGHLTRADQRALNQQENVVSHDIGR